MIRCQTCRNENLDTSRFCDECGTKLVPARAETDPQPPAYVPPPSAEVSGSRAVHVTSVGGPPIGVALESNTHSFNAAQQRPRAVHPTLVTERAAAPGTALR